MRVMKTYAFIKKIRQKYHISIIEYSSADLSLKCTCALIKRIFYYKSFSIILKNLSPECNN